MLDSTNLCALKEYHNCEKDNNKRKECSKISNDDKKSECEHYKRKCKFYTPCCNRVYSCRFCHDEQEDHILKRDDVTKIVCSKCGKMQNLQQNCESCGLLFGKYFCLECKLFDDENKEQYHCKGCGICRIGDQSKFFHCEGCNMCLPINLKGNHKCIENLSRTNCPVCLEDIHTSREPSQITPCHHLIHKSCFAELTVTHNTLVCPICSKILYHKEEIQPLWDYYDKEIELMPMTYPYEDLLVYAQCKDCETSSLTQYHVIGLKCQICGGYNTVRDIGPFYRSDELSLVTVEITEFGEIIEIGIEATEDFQPEESEQYDLSSICSSSTIIPSWLFEIK